MKGPQRTKISEWQGRFQLHYCRRGAWWNAKPGAVVVMCMYQPLLFSSSTPLEFKACHPFEVSNTFPYSSYTSIHLDSLARSIPLLLVALLLVIGVTHKLHLSISRSMELHRRIIHHQFRGKILVVVHHRVERGKGLGGAIRRCRDGVP